LQLHGRTEGSGELLPAPLPISGVHCISSIIPRRLLRAGFSYACDSRSCWGRKWHAQIFVTSEVSIWQWRDHTLDVPTTLRFIVEKMDGDSALQNICGTPSTAQQTPLTFVLLRVSISWVGQEPGKCCFKLEAVELWRTRRTQHAIIRRKPFLFVVAFLCIWLP